jgi:hypothetical protein
MSFLKRDLLRHFKWLQTGVLGLGAEAFLDPCTFVLRLRVGETRRVLYPQFLTFTNSVRQYTPSFNSDAAQFIGWCPYVNRRWPLASEKLLFKQFAVRHGLRTPEYSTDANAVMNDVIVKKSVSSFATNIKGPFKSSSDHKLEPATGEYFERFIPGWIAKIWYWEAQPVCMEMEKMPHVRGNGVSTVRGLINARLFQRGRKRGLQHLEAFLAYQGVGLDTVLAAGQDQTVEFRYGSPLLTPAGARDVDLTKEIRPELEPQLRDIGRKLWLAIPEAVRSNTVFTVDAIVDEHDQIWTLEMNSNPFIHPYVYPTMLQSLFASTSKGENANQQVPALST